MDVTENDPTIFDVRQAQKLSGALIWLATRTRPDIVYAQSRISSLATRAPRRALECGKRVLRYIAGTLNYGLVFSSCSSNHFWPKTLY